METVAQRSTKIIRDHLVNHNGQLYCQALLGCGFVGNTVPSDIPGHVGMEELPTSDSSNPGIVVGAALAGRRPIYVIRYQGFGWYNLVTIVNYAAKSKEMWGEPCPVYVRGIGMEGHIGPVASNSHHSMVLRMPGIKCFAPMTPNEYQWCWDEFMNGDDPVYCSETRRSFGISEEMPDDLSHDLPDATIIGISVARLGLKKAKNRLESDLPPNTVKINIAGLVSLNPLILSEKLQSSIRASNKVYLIDSDYEQGGAVQNIAYQIHEKTGVLPKVLGLDNKSAGFADHCDNLTPDTDRIIRFVTETYFYKN